MGSVSSKASKIQCIRNDDQHRHQELRNTLYIAHITSISSAHIYRKFSDIYRLGAEIGIGSFASVHQCYRISDLEEFAVKRISKRILSEKELIGLRDEISILKKLSYKNVIKMVDVFDDGKIVWMVLELCDGKDLLLSTLCTLLQTHTNNTHILYSDRIVEEPKNHFSESKAAEITYTLATTLQYLHEHYVIHRDLKPENILFGVDGTLKITDFGLAHYELAYHEIDPMSFDLVRMDTCCGTPHYVSPEVITQSLYTCKCDLWSLGVILYIMLVGYQPFNADNLNGIYKLITAGKYNFKSKRWKTVSKDAIDLVVHLLEVDPKKRYSPSDVLSHKWIVKHMNHS